MQPGYKDDITYVIKQGSMVFQSDNGPTRISCSTKYVITLTGVWYHMHVHVLAALCSFPAYDNVHIAVQQPFM